MLDSLRGLDETIQYGQGEKRKEQMSERSKELASVQENLSRMEGSQRSVTNMVILLASFGMLALTIYLYTKGGIGFEGVLTCTIAMMGSFGPVVALSSLSNNLNQTLASGERVLSLLEEAPLVEEIPGDAASGGDHAFAGAEAQNVTFAYEDETILDQYSLKLEPGKITGIHGASGSGKSTILKLLMRFWDVQTGRVSVDGADVREIPMKHLRDMESYVTQETHLFHDSIANNIAIAKPGATREEIMEAAKKASIHDFIMTLPNGYDTEVGELGDTLSGGEKQRIGIARAFLHDTPILQDIDFTLKQGHTLGIMGMTGSGKTTIVNLLERFYDVTDGSICLDGHDIRTLPLRTVRDTSSVVMQDVFLFSDTISENVRLGSRSTMKSEEVHNAVSAACASEFVDHLSDQYETVIGERGMGLSGGQKQRLSIARALAKQAPILVLDDSTSALDMETEYEIQSHLAEKKDVSKIIIAHRISSVQSADEILYLDHGRIAERGTHESLMAQKGLYYSTWEAQYGDYHKAKAALEQALPANA